MRLTAYMLSCPARESMRNQTLANLAGTDWAEQAIVEIDQTTHERLQQRQTETSFRLLRRAVTDGSDFFLFLEDDLDFNRNLRSNLEHWYPLTHTPARGHFFASLYNPNVRMLETDDANSFSIADPASVYGSQAFVLSLATARHILDNWENHIGMQDIKMSRLAAQVTPIFYHRPSLVQHLGVDSAWGGHYHKAVDFQKSWISNAHSSNISPPLILAAMRRIDGWLEDEEARVLIDALAALPGTTSTIVEVGSYCGKSTVVFGLALKELNKSDSRIFSVDSYDGRISTVEGGILCTGSTLDKFQRNVATTGISSLVTSIVGSAPEVPWNQTIDFLFIDGLHDYENVARDYRHFSHWVRQAGYLAFHDCAPHFPGVKRLVDEIVKGGEYQVTARAKSLILLRKLATSPPELSGRYTPQVQATETSDPR